jgi:uncharacterized protein YmfQ (DUF2313 family)
MLQNMPDYYQESNTVTNILTRQAEEMDAYSTSVQDLMNQLFVSTATWGLSYWESILDVPTDTSLTVDERRSALLAKLRGIGTVNASMLQNIAASFVNGEIDVVENFSNYEIEIHFVGTRGIPSNLTLVRDSLERVVPAHLALTFIYTYLIWGELSTHTWNDLKSQNGGSGLTWDQLRVWK